MPAKRTISPFRIRRNKPNVKIVRGNVTKTRIGFINAFKTPRTIDKMNNDCTESIFIPGMM